MILCRLDIKRYKGISNHFKRCLLLFRSDLMQQKDYLTNLMNFMYKRLSKDIKCAYLAKIVKLTKPTASIQPLAQPFGQKLPMVENVPFILLPYRYKYIDTVGEYEMKSHKKMTDVKLNYQAGDTVLVDVLDLDDEYFKNKGAFNVMSHRKHAVDFSVIIGKIANKSDFKNK